MNNPAYYKETQHNKLRRCFNWDYRSPAIYMITLTLADRTKPLLGKVLPILPQGKITPNEIKAIFQPSALGDAILAHWKEIPFYTPEIKPLYLQLMEEHLHGIIRVTNQMRRPLGNAIAGFKTWCNKHYKEYTNSQTQLFSSNFNDSILFHSKQLERMFNYLRDNPRRLAVRRQFPNLFTTVHHLERIGGTFTAYGNIFLLDKPEFHLLQVSRSATPEEIEHKREKITKAIQNNAVIVSACISPGEKTLMHEAMAMDASLIALENNGISKMYKPAGTFFDACAKGRLLILAPSEWDTPTSEKKKITRDQCYVLNELATKIAGGLPQSIKYSGQSPTDLNTLLKQAGF